jgi:hypothetical protein
MTVHKAVAKAAWYLIGGKRSYYRSRMEANYAKFLQWQKEQAQILDWEHEPETFRFGQLRRGVTNYKPDFRVTHLDGSFSFAETKGYFDAKSKTKIKRMAKYHPTVKLLVVDSKAMRQLASTFSRIVKGWE